MDSSMPARVLAVPRLDGKETKKRTTTLIKTPQVEVTHVSVPAGSSIPTHEAQGEVILHCLAGRVTVAAHNQQFDLEAGRLLFLLVNDPFMIDGVDDASVLVTVVAAKTGENVALIG